jgi:3-phenylpropionate/trans-cinnamate dioxygenase ferredoxin reductase component
MTTTAGVTDRVVVVGASMGGLRAAEAVVKAGFGGEVVVVGAEPHMPYNRPPLSKDALHAEPDLAGLQFRVPRAAKNVQWRLGTTVTGADLAAHTVTLDSGDVLGWRGLVAASGLRPRRLSVPGPFGGRHVLRTVEDALALRASMTPGTRLVVIGAGFVGCEVAATARRLGVEVDVVAPEVVPMNRPLQRELGAALQRRHEAHGVRFHLGVVPVEFIGTTIEPDRVGAVKLSDDSVVEADIVVEAVGSDANVEWLAGNGLDLRDGLLCDQQLRVEGRPDLVACGDIARFPNLLFDEIPRRIEHWTMVTDTARRAGHTLGLYLSTGELDSTPFHPVPSFWSDQYDLRVQSFGAVGLGPDDVRVLEGDLDGEVALGYHRDGALVGVVMVGLAGRHAFYRDLIAGAAAVQY